MSETPSDHGWDVVNSFALGRQDREKTLDVTVEVYDETLSQEEIDRLKKYAEHILADAEVNVEYSGTPEMDKPPYPTEATPVEDNDA